MQIRSLIQLSNAVVLLTLTAFTFFSMGDVVAQQPAAPAAPPAAGVQQGAKKPDLTGKVVLANLDRYDAILRFGKTRRTIKPKKASVLSAKKYPVNLEIWSGNTKTGWIKQPISAAGIYGLNFKNGKWMVAQLKKGKTNRAANPPANVLRKRIVQPNQVRRARTGTTINADRSRWSPLARVAWAAGSIYQFVRDEQDRELLRDLIIRGRYEDLAELQRYIEGYDKIAAPHKAEIMDSLKELDKLSEADWKAVDAAGDAEWAQARSDLGDLVSTDQWNQFNTDFGGEEGLWQNDTSNLDLSEIDLGGLDDDGNIDIGELDLAENFDVGDLGIDENSYDLGGFDDFGGYDGAMGVDAMDYGGGGDFGGDFGDADMGDFGGDDFGGDFGDDF